ncbi:MAG: prepilin peptidase [Planctomycetales bacterium]|nr:prepilin peptidase [Planctomycetales bacterium]
MSIRLSREIGSLIAFWITLPIPARLVLLSIIGLVLGVIANLAIYRFAWQPRSIGPWGPKHEKAGPRQTIDRIPIVGWFALRRESGIHGSGFWIRPLLLEIAMAISVPAYYWFVTQTGLLFPAPLRNAAAITAYEPWMTTVFASHLVMISLMVAATFIDFDDQTIPDELTVPGTLIALALGAMSMNVFLPALPMKAPLAPMAFQMPFPAPGPQWFGPTGWWTGIGIWTGWCFALANRRWITRRGIGKALEYFFASLLRDGRWPLLLGIWIVGGIGIRIVFGFKGASWIGLLTALVGLAVGGGVVWAIRIVGSVAMRREAMGFGDVTLMAMIGAFIGWQGAVMSFFLAPIAAIAIVLVYFIITRNSEIPFGPYLCVGTMLSIFGWDRLVNGWFLGNLAILGPFMLWLFVAMTGIMGVMLYFWRIFKERFFGE